MMKPLIGLIPLVDEERESYWMVPGYMKGIQEAGGIPFMLPLSEDEEDIASMVRQMDGFLLTGGQDVDPMCYGAEKQSYCGEPCTMRDKMEAILLREALKLDKPIYGICRGIQFLNAFLGGTLYQDLPKEMPSDIEHHQTPPYDEPVHEVIIKEKTPLFKLAGKTKLKVNSYHHQAVKELADKLSIMAEAPDGLIEAVYMPEKSFVMATQWHPEFSYKKDETSRKIFEGFVDACRQNKAFIKKQSK